MAKQKPDELAGVTPAPADPQHRAAAGRLGTSIEITLGGDRHTSYALQPEQRAAAIARLKAARIVPRSPGDPSPAQLAELARLLQCTLRARPAAGGRLTLVFPGPEGLAELLAQDQAELIAAAAAVAEHNAI